MNGELLDHFVRRLEELFGAPYNLSRFLFGRWGIEGFSSLQQVEALFASDLFRKTILPNGRISLLRRYTKAEIEALGTSLTPTGGNGHEFTDSRFGFRWRQVYHGMAETWLDLYSVIDPQVDESKIQDAKRAVGQ